MKTIEELRKELYQEGDAIYPGWSLTCGLVMAAADRYAVGAFDEGVRLARLFPKAEVAAHILAKRRDEIKEGVK